MRLPWLRGFYKDRIVEAGAYSEFNPFRKSLEDAEEIITKATAPAKAKKPVDVEEVRTLLNKLGEVGHKAKGESDDQSKTLFKQLLRRPAFKDRCSKAITALKKLVPPTTTATGGGTKPGAGGTSPSQDGTGQGGGNTGTQTKKPKEETKGTTGNGQAGPPKEGLALKAEELLSEIFEILERNLGDDCEDLPQIEEEIQQVVDTWVSSNAQKSVS